MNSQAHTPHANQTTTKSYQTPKTVTGFLAFLALYGVGVAAMVAPAVVAGAGAGAVGTKTLSWVLTRWDGTKTTSTPTAGPAGQ